MKALMYGSALSVAMMFVATQQASAIYKYVDENGRTHYTQTKPKNQEVQQLTLRSTSARAKPVDKVSSVDASSQGEEPTELQAAKNQLKEQQAAILKRDCLALKAKMDSLAIDGRVYDTVDGERVYLSGEQINDQRRKTRDQFYDRCQGQI